MDFLMKILSEHDIRPEQFKKWKMLGVAFQVFLNKQGLSSNMWVVARKPRD
jgi:hypothetical protein